MTRINDLSAIEARLLELAHTTDARITAPALAFFAPCSVENAQRVLDDLAARNQLSMDVQDDGTITYEMFGRQKLAAPSPQLPALRREAGLVAIDRPSLGIRLAARPGRAGTCDRDRGSPLIAALLAMWIPGAGHLYAGRFVAAVLWFLAITAGYSLILPGLVLHLFSIVSAATSSARQRTPLLFAPASEYRRLLPAPALQR